MMVSFSKLRRNQEQTKRHLLTFFICLFFGISLLVKVFGNIFIKKQFQLSNIKHPSEYSYLGKDYPESWPIHRGNVLMAFDNPKHFRLDTNDGAAEWKSLIPGLGGDDGVVYLGTNHQPYTISMFHQLRCLDIIRNETVTGWENGEERVPTPLARHCLNYLRQMVMCRGDLELESFQFASNKNPIDMHGVYECKDWEAVYRETRDNQKEYDAWRQGRGENAQ